MDEQLLSKADEIELAKAIEVGLYAEHLLAGACQTASAGELRTLVEQGELARRRFFLANLGLVGSLVEHWMARAGLAADELFQEGCVGLGEAIVQFDWRRGTRFSTLAWKRINYALMAAAATRCGEIDARPSQAKAALEMRRDWQRREAEVGAELSPTAYAKVSGQSVGRVMSLVNLRRVAPIDECVHGLPVVNAEPSLGPGWDADLSDLERRLIVLRYWLEPALSLSAAADELGSSVTKARRIEQRALMKLRARLQTAA